MTNSILIVDDDAFFRSMLVRALTVLGCDFTYCSDGEECIEVIESGLFEYDLVLMDVHMPNMLGSDAALMIRNLANNPLRTVPIIALTGDTAWHNAGRIRGSGFTGFIPKPSDMETLMGALIECLDRWTQRTNQMKRAIS